MTTLNLKTLLNKRSEKLPYAIGASVAALMILVFTGIIFWQESKQTELKAEVSTQNATIMLAKHIEGVFDTADTLLQAVEYQYKDDKKLGILEATRFNDYLMQALKWSSDFDNIGFIDTDGLYRFGKDSNKAIDLSDRDYFKKLRDKPPQIDTGPMIFSDPIFSRISKQWVLIMARRVDLPDGNFGGVIFLRWDIDRLSTLLKSVKMGSGGALLLRTSDMTQIARYPESDDPASGPGNRKVSQKLIDLAKKSPESNFYRAVSPMDNTERYYTYLKVGKYPFYVIAGQAINGHLVAWSDSHLTMFALSGSMILLVFIGAWHMSRLTQRRIRAELDNFAQRVLSASPVAMLLLSKQGVVLKANPAAEKIFDHEESALVGLSVGQLQPEGTRPIPMQGMLDGVDSQTLIKEAPYKRRDGTTFTALRAISAVPDESGQISYYMETLVDITELKRVQENLRELAETDKLTGLLNRRSGDSVIEQAIYDAEINNASCAVILGDIDHFKRINDTFGHLAGDRILANVANQLRSAVRTGDYCVRWGGEEFLIILPRCSQSIAATLADRIRCEIAVLNDDQDGPITMSFGVGDWVRPETPQSLVNRADQALYRAKEAGRNRVELADELVSINNANRTA